MIVRARWPTLVVGWAIAVAVTALIAWRAVHFVGSQFSSDVALTRPPAAASPTPGVGRGHQPPQRTPPGTTRPSPRVSGGNVPGTSLPGSTPGTPGRGTGGPGTTPPVVGVPVVRPVPAPRPNPRPVPAPTPQPPGAQPPGAQPPGAQPPSDDGEPGVAAPPPVVPAPDVTPPSPAPQPTPVPITISDRRAVDTAGGMATFTCTNVDVVALVTAAPAPGYQVGPVRVREDSRMDVSFVGPTEQDQVIDARCRNGALNASIN